MLLFETILVLLAGATVLSAIARKMRVPYPTLLALGGACVAFVPGAPRLELPPDLILALFVAPVLVDAAFDASLRDLRRNWPSVLSLVVGAVGLTTLATAFVARMLLPDLPWGAAIALGALAAPPDAVAALAVLRQVEPPHRLRMVLEGESLLNDASALLTYRLAVTAVAAGGFDAATAAPTFLLVVIGSVVAGWVMAKATNRLFHYITEAPSAVIFQFCITFGAWLAAERLGLSPVVTMVVFGLCAARGSGAPMAAHLRIPSFAIWETATVVLNVLAFTLIGLQIRPILEPLSPDERIRYLAAALVILAVVILVRPAWVLLHFLAAKLFGGKAGGDAPTFKGALVVSWSGMRGIVTLAAAMALPEAFPYRDFVQLTAFVVVLGTLAVQGATLGPLLRLLRLPKDDTIATELAVARRAALKAGVAELVAADCPAGRRLQEEYVEALDKARSGGDARDTTDNALRRRAVAASRAAIADLRHNSTIGDDAYRKAEEELDWLELSARPRE